MNTSELEKQALIGVQEAIAWHTVAIDISLGSKDNPDWGTGSLVKIKGKSFVVTCKHVVKPVHRNEDLRFLYRSEKAFQWVDKEVIKETSIHKIYKSVYRTFPQEIPIINRIYSDDEDDLVLLEVDTSSCEVSQYKFFDISLNVLTPEANTPIYYMGLIDFRTFDTDEYNIDPHGLSGCGVWTRTPSGPDKLWTTNIHLVGVQHGFFRRSEVLKATRIERLIQLTT
jgi:hypothetical protein